MTNFSNLEEVNTHLQYGHSASVAGALTLIVAGYALQMHELLNKTEERGVSKLMTTGAGTFAAGFAVASLCHWYVSSCIATHQKQLKLMRQILKDKHGLFSEAKAAIIDAGAGTVAASPSTSNPLLTSAATGSTGAGTGLELTETASSPGSIVSPTRP